MRKRIMSLVTICKTGLLLAALASTVVLSVAWANIGVKKFQLGIGATSAIHYQH